MEIKRIVFYSFASLAGLSASIGDAMLNEWAKGGTKALWLIGGFIFWNISLLLFMGMLRRELFSTSVVFFVVANYLVSIAFSQLIFHENITVYQKLGIVFALIAIVLIQISR
jgi:drug/metabolite transporter (DMT)-like permease